MIGREKIIQGVKLSFLPCETEFNHPVKLSLTNCCRIDDRAQKIKPVFKLQLSQTFLKSYLSFSEGSIGGIPIGPVSIGPVRFVQPDLSSIDWSSAFGPARLVQYRLVQCFLSSGLYYLTLTSTCKLTLISAYFINMNELNDNIADDDDDERKKSHGRYLH